VARQLEGNQLPGVWRKRSELLRYVERGGKCAEQRQALQLCQGAKLSSAQRTALCKLLELGFSSEVDSRQS